MKKLFLAVVVTLGISTIAQAQTNAKAIGGRIGLGGEVSYQHPLQTKTRAEVNLGMYGWSGYGDFVLTGIHQWLFAPNNGFNLYAGVGPQIGSYWYGENNNKYGLGLGVAGQFGGEYNFSDIPLQLSLDWRPSFSILPAKRGFGYDGFGLGIRYRF